ncbi:MAG TPA: response regulator [Chloroflexota bacterium]|jgi:chemotaxis protein histidine kinase CheA
MNPIDFLDEFQAEAAEKLDIIAAQLLRLERDATNPQPVREMFLAAHTIKGGAAMLRLTAVETLAHALEDLLSVFRDQERMLDGGTADLLFQTIDQLRALIAAADPEAVGAEVDAAIETFAARLRSGATEAPAAPASTAPLAPRALVVDDSATVRELHALVLESAGFEVVQVDNGDAALARARAEAFAVVVAGIELRGLRGFELVRALRTLPGYAEVPLILMSADADAERERRSLEAGASALLRKTSLDDEQLTSALPGSRRHAA